MEPDETAGYVATCPSLPGCYSQGDTVDGALDNIREAIELCLEDMQAHGEAGLPVVFGRDAIRVVEPTGFSVAQPGARAPGPDEGFVKWTISYYTRCDKLRAR